jgi:hypothetical protein
MLLNVLRQQVNNIIRGLIEKGRIEKKVALQKVFFIKFYELDLTHILVL